MTRYVIHNHLGKRARDNEAGVSRDASTQAFKVKVRRLATGADYNIRIFAASQAQAEDRARLHAARMERATPDGFRIVSSELDPDQSRPSNYDAPERDFRGVVSRDEEERARAESYRRTGITRV